MIMNSCSDLIKITGYIYLFFVVYKIILSERSERR